MSSDHPVSGVAGRYATALFELAEAQGFHSLWFPDHVCMTIDSDSFHTANQSGTRAYQPRHNMLDAAVCMGAVAVRTSRLKLGTSCLISPYRDPLSDARQFSGSW